MMDEEYKMIKSIVFVESENKEYCDASGGKLESLDNLKRVNIFVGANNSGKSRLLRRIATDSNSQILVDNPIPYKKCKEAMAFLEAVKRLNAKLQDDKKITLYLKDGYTAADVFSEGVKFYKDVQKLNSNAVYNSEKFRVKNTFMDLRRTMATNDYPKRTFSKYSIFYIPVLRGVEKFDAYFSNLQDTNDGISNLAMTETQRRSLERFRNNAKRIYLNKIMTAYGIKEERIFTAENLYDEITNKLLGDEAERRFVRDFEKFLSDKFFDSETITITPIKNRGYLNIKIGHSPEHALHNLGDGIKQLITIFYKIFEKRNEEAIFLIEEPEINLHPGFQRQLLEILLSNVFPKHQYFITTHSNHLIDSCFGDKDVAIFNFQSDKKTNDIFKVTKTSNGDLAVLDSLEVNNSSVFLANSTIWVEGLSDKILLSKMLRVYLKDKGLDSKIKEDIHFAFVEYEGANITHWDFTGTDKSGELSHALSITNRAFIICDNDNDSKQKRKKALKAVFGDRYYEHDVREMENTIKLEVLEKTLFSDGIVKYKNGHNGRRNQYATKRTYLGKYIDETYDTGKQYAGSRGTGTIIDKIGFAKQIVENIDLIDDLSEYNKNLCEKLLDFIIRSNALTIKREDLKS